MLCDSVLLWRACVRVCVRARCAWLVPVGRRATSIDALCPLEARRLRTQGADGAAPWAATPAGSARPHCSEPEPSSVAVHASPIRCRGLCVLRGGALSCVRGCVCGLVRGAWPMCCVCAGLLFVHLLGLVAELVKATDLRPVFERSRGSIPLGSILHFTATRPLVRIRRGPCCREPRVDSGKNPPATSLGVCFSSNSTTPAASIGTDTDALRTSMVQTFRKHMISTGDAAAPCW